MTAVNLNGQAAKVAAKVGGNRISGTCAPSLVAVSSPGFGFSAADTEKVGYRMRMPVATGLLGLGTTGALLGHGVAQTSIREFGRLPGGFDYLSVDSAAPRLDMDVLHFIQTGVDGNGTVPRMGRRNFRKHYRHIRDCFSRQVEGLFQPDPEFPLKTHPREAVNIWVVAGSGGTSGGCLHSAITLVHDVLEDFKVAEPRVYVLLIGAEMPTRDRRRQVKVIQHRVVRDTAANNAIKIAGDMASPRNLRVSPPGRPAFALRASRRVWSFTLADQSNGLAQFSTTEGLTQMLVSAVFCRIFTEAGIYLADRFKDLDQLGETGRATH